MRPWALGRDAEACREKWIHASHCLNVGKLVII